MSDSPILLEHEGALSTLTVNRPERLNALDRDTLLALGAAIDEVQARAPRCLIVTGAGDKAFVAGADIAAMSKMDPAQAAEFARLSRRCRARRSPRSTVSRWAAVASSRWLATSSTPRTRPSWGSQRSSSA